MRLEVDAGLGCCGVRRGQRCDEQDGDDTADEARSSSSRCSAPASVDVAGPVEVGNRVRQQLAQLGDVGGDHRQPGGQVLEDLDRRPEPAELEGAELVRGEGGDDDSTKTILPTTENGLGASTSPNSRMNPFYFGKSDRRLFGVYHPPKRKSAGGAAAVLCYPAFAEYLRSHRTFRQLALLLAAGGVPTLRFDYYATGDSDGNGEESSLQRWGDDVSAAVDEVLALSGSRAVSLIGMRLGGTLAALVAKDNPRVVKLVLWDPVVSGEQYLRELARQDAALNVRRRMTRSSEADHGLLGFPLPPDLRKELEELRIGPVGHLPVLLIGSEHESRAQSLGDFGSGEVEFLDERPRGEPVWSLDTVNPSELVPAQLIQTIVAWLSGERSDE